MQMKSSSLIFALALTFIVGCSARPATKIVGKWQETSGMSQIEFSSDGTMTTSAMGFGPFNGKWRILDDGRLEMEVMGIQDRPVKTVETITFDGDRLTIKESPDRERIYKRVTAFSNDVKNKPEPSPSQKIVGKWQHTSNGTELEFRSKGWMSVTDGLGPGLTGHWSLADTDLYIYVVASVDADKQHYPPDFQPFVPGYEFSITLRGDTLTLRNSKEPGRPASIYNRVTEFRPRAARDLPRQSTIGPVPLPAKTAEEAYKNGDGAISKGDFDAAIANLTEAIRLDPQCGKAYSLRGFAHLEKKEYDQAIADYDAAIRLDPSCPAYRNRGLAYFYKGNLDQAFSDYNEAIRLDPNGRHAYLLRSVAYGKKGEIEKQIADLTEAIRLDPKWVVAYEVRAEAYGKKGETEKQIADLTEAIRLDPKNADAYYDRSAAYGRIGDTDKQIADYNEAVRLAPENPKRKLMAVPIALSAEDLSRQYMKNKLAADEKFKDRVLRVTGAIERIDRDSNGRICVCLRGGHMSIVSVECLFDDDKKQEVLALSEDRTVTIIGQCRGLPGMYVTLEDLRVSKRAQKTVC